MTGNPEKPLPKNWGEIPGATGCTSQACSFRDNYYKFTELNSIHIGVTSQSISEIKEMTSRLHIPFDILSDENLILTKILKLPTFNVGDKIFIKRLTLIIEKSNILKFFYPIFPPDLHYNEVIEWL